MMYVVWIIRPSNMLFFQSFACKKSNSWSAWNFFFLLQFVIFNHWFNFRGQKHHYHYALAYFCVPYHFIYLLCGWWKICQRGTGCLRFRAPHIYGLSDQFRIYFSLTKSSDNFWTVRDDKKSKNSNERRSLKFYSIRSEFYFHSIFIWEA